MKYFIILVGYEYITQIISQYRNEIFIDYFCWFCVARLIFHSVPNWTHWNWFNLKCLGSDQYTLRSRTNMFAFGATHFLSWDGDQVGKTQGFPLWTFLINPELRIILISRAIKPKKLWLFLGEGLKEQMRISVPAGASPLGVCDPFCWARALEKQELFPHLPALKITKCFVTTLLPPLTVNFSTHCSTLASILLFSIGRGKTNTFVFVRNVSLTLVSQEPGSCQSHNARQINIFFFSEMLIIPFCAVLSLCFFWSVNVEVTSKSHFWNIICPSAPCEFICSPGGPRAEGDPGSVLQQMPTASRAVLGRALAAGEGADSSPLSSTGETHLPAEIAGLPCESWSFPKPWDKAHLSVLVRKLNG